MTTPSSRYYESRILARPAWWLPFLQHRWRRFYAAERIRSFVWEHGGWIFTYGNGQLTLHKAPVHPSWQVPERYFVPIVFSLSRDQVQSIRSVLAQVPFSRLRTDAAGFVGLMDEELLGENFHCRISPCFSYRYADRINREELEPLLLALLAIAEDSEEYAQICRMEAGLFTEARWAQLHPGD